MRIMMIGSGAREHAAASALSSSQDDLELFCFGSSVNPGIQVLCTGYETGDITQCDISVELARRWKIDLVFIGPEAPLESGTADALRDQGFPCAAPGAAGAQIETSKIFARELVKKLVPSAVPRYHTVKTMAQAEEALDLLGEHFVIKEDGLRGGKGVKVSGDHLSGREEALACCREILQRSREFIIEERLEGEEFSLLSFCDGESIIHMPPVQDHKRLKEGDRGPNTGGMGSFTGPWGVLPFLLPSDIQRAQEIQETVFRGIEEETGEPYRGILYGGYMACASKTAVIEYNARFGDPEALNLLPLLEGSFAKILQAAASGGLKDLDIRFSPKASVCRYLVPLGYPQESVKGIALKIPPADPSVHLFLGSVDLQDKELVTAGSRTLAVTALGDTIEQAHQASLHAAEDVDGPLYFRGDIGSEALLKKRIDHMDELRGHPLRIGVLGSTRGTSLQLLLEISRQSDFPGEVCCVISDRRDAQILARAGQFSVPRHCVPKQRREQTIHALLEAYRADLVLCVGYMRILSQAFCRAWEGRLFNIHPSLLPDFAGGMDMDVHAAVLAAGVSETGCTVHHVTPEVDGGAPVLQKRCRVLPGDTAVSLKKRVQELESLALVELCRDFQKAHKHDRQNVRGTEQ